MVDIGQYVPKKEFLQLLDGKIGRSRLQEMLQQGELDAVQPGGPGGRYFVNRAEAERLLKRVGAKK